MEALDHLGQLPDDGLGCADNDKCLSKNIFTYTANFQDVVRYGAMTVLGLNEAE